MKRMLCACIAAAALCWCSPAAAQEAISDRARQLFADGVAALEAPGGPDYRNAYRAFQDAYADSPTPKILGNLGLCAFHLERDTEAEDAYRRYLKEVPGIPQPERERIERDLRAMQARAAYVLLTLAPVGVRLHDVRKTSDGQVVNDYDTAAAEVSLRVHAGSHALTVSKDGYKPAEIAFEVKPGDKARVKVALVKEPVVTPAPAPAPAPAPTPTPTPKPAAEPDLPDPPPPPPQPRDAADDGIWPGVWVGVGITGLLAVGAAITGGLALSKQSEYASYQNGASRADAEVVRGDGEILNYVTDGLWAGAAAFGIATVIVLVVDLSSTPDVAVDARGVGIRF